MRKGQIKILDRAKRWGYSDDCITILKNENLTIKELETILYRFYRYKSKDYEWLKALLSIEKASSQDDTELIYAYINKELDAEKEVLPEMIYRINTTKKLFTFLSQENIVCEKYSDALVVINFGYSDLTPILIKISENYCNSISNDSFDEYYRIHYGLSSFLNEIVQSATFLKNPKDFLSQIEQNQIVDISQYEDFKSEYIKQLAPFKLLDADGIPDDIKNIDFKGYEVNIKVNGYNRNVYQNEKAMYITCSPIYSVNANKQGQLFTKANSNKNHKVIFNYKESTFTTGYAVRDGFKYRPAQLRDLFFAISIGNTDEDKNNADSVVSYLCNYYDTYIFKDLYEDYLSSDGLLMPLLITEAACYKSREDLMYNHYHMPIKCKWNRRNVNLAYIILKLHKRMTPDALARVLQYKDTLKVEKVGRKRYKFAYILYSALYDVSLADHHDGTIEDALWEEYQLKALRFLPINQTINAHNHREKIVDNGVKVKIQKNTNFRKLIDNMPKEFELIHTKKRLIEEAAMQKNCVAGYAQDISNDTSMIYSTVYEESRHTIQICFVNGQYKVVQCYKACNKSPNCKLTNQLKEIITTINKNQPFITAKGGENELPEVW